MCVGVCANLFVFVRVCGCVCVSMHMSVWVHVSVNMRAHAHICLPGLGCVGREWLVTAAAPTFVQLKGPGQVGPGVESSQGHGQEVMGKKSRRADLATGHCSLYSVPMGRKRGKYVASYISKEPHM